MKKIFVANATFNSSKIQLKDTSTKDLYNKVLNEGVAVIKNAFPKKILNELTKEVFSWSKKNKSKPSQTWIDENFYAIEKGISPIQKTPHNYVGYNLNYPNLLDKKFRETFNKIYIPFSQLYKDLSGNFDASTRKNNNSFKIHPQIIQYPSGGGFLGKHMHKFLPQKIGLILSLSERNKDFNTGSTFFEINKETIDTNDIHDIGDILLFRYDVIHGIYKIDPEETLNYDSIRGRWTFILPYY